jgi:hypothetical protein
MNPTARPAGTPRRNPTTPAGWIYLHHTGYDPHKYVGQSKRPVWNRINEERRTFPWGADLLPGRAGYTILRRVESCGDTAADAILLDLAEAEEIQRWWPTENANRPDPQVFRQRLAALHADPAGGRDGGASWGSRVAPVRARPPRPAPAPRSAPLPREHRWRRVGFVILAIFCAVVAGRVTAHAHNPTTPWVVVPVVAVMGPTIAFHLFDRATRRRPARRRRRTRRRK